MCETVKPLWECPTCTFKNTYDKQQCVLCGTDKGAKPKPKKEDSRKKCPGYADAEGKCGLFMSDDATYCDTCTIMKLTIDKTKEEEDVGDKGHETYECKGDSCTNKITKGKICEDCKRKQKQKMKDMGDGKDKVAKMAKWKCEPCEKNGEILYPHIKEYGENENNTGTCAWCGEKRKIICQRCLEVHDYNNHDYNNKVVNCKKCNNDITCKCKIYIVCVNDHWEEYNGIIPKYGDNTLQCRVSECDKRDVVLCHKLDEDDHTVPRQEGKKPAIDIDNDKDMEDMEMLIYDKQIEIYDKDEPNYIIIIRLDDKPTQEMTFTKEIFRDLCKCAIIEFIVKKQGDFSRILSIINKRKYVIKHLIIQAHGGPCDSGSRLLFIPNTPRGAKGDILTCDGLNNPKSKLEQQFIQTCKDRLIPYASIKLISCHLGAEYNPKIEESKRACTLEEPHGKDKYKEIGRAHV